jgi:hypothetical protein
MASRFVLGDYLHGALWGLPVRASRYPSGYLVGLLSGSYGFFWGIGWGSVGWLLGAYDNRTARKLGARWCLTLGGKRVDLSHGAQRSI